MIEGFRWDNIRIVEVKICNAKSSGENKLSQEFFHDCFWRNDNLVLLVMDVENDFKCSDSKEFVDLRGSKCKKPV